MDSIKWCLKQKKGLELVEPNRNMADSYLKMAEESINELNRTKSKLWGSSITYYIFYYSLYSLMIYIGVKSEIHSCSKEFMRLFLFGYYSSTDIDMFEKAFNARQDLQYYANRSVDASNVEMISKYSKTFFIKTKDIISSLKQIEVNKIRSEFEKYCKK